LFAVDAREQTKAEKKYLEAGKKWQAIEGGYALIQGTKPQTLGYELNDSPTGLAAWIVEKFYWWSDCDGNIENCFTKDELLTNLTIYWVTAIINSAIRLYYEAMKMPASNSSNKIDVPAGVTIFPKDMVNAPEEFGRHIFNIVQWTKMPRGGHFAAMEQPALFCEDIRKFAKIVVA
jgi:pimeloyl-ACP methyl ester carboxylesterase